MRPSQALPLLLLFSACHRESAEKPAPVIDARPGAQPTATPAPLPRDPSVVPALEISGEIELAPEVSPPNVVYVYLSRGDCLDAAAPLVRRMPVTEHGAFLIHTVAEPGTELTVCAAAEAVGDKEVSLYGKAEKTLRVGEQSEQEIRELKIKLAPGVPRRFPVPAKTRPTGNAKGKR